MPSRLHEVNLQIVLIDMLEDVNVQFFWGMREESGNWSFSTNCTLGVTYDNFMLSRQREMVEKLFQWRQMLSPKGIGRLLKSGSGWKSKLVYPQRQTSKNQMSLREAVQNEPRI